MKKIYTSLITLFIALTFNAQDTFSICAIDTITGEVGSAGASCVYINQQGVMIISDVHPGVGVVHTQAWYLAANKVYAHQLMNLGLSPDQIIDSLVANDAQNNPTLRQYGIVDFRDGIVSSAAYTGVNTDDYKNHITGPNYSIQGNILLGPEILDSIEARFLNSEGELVCRLMEALQGANVPGADARCLSDGTSSIGGFLRVAKPDDEAGNYYFEVNLPSVNEGVDPIDSLQSLVDIWGGCEYTGLKEDNEYNAVKVFPNPGDEAINIRLPDELVGIECEIAIYDSYGKRVYIVSDFKDGETTINTSAFQAGMYFYQLLQEGVVKSGGTFILK